MRRATNKQTKVKKKVPKNDGCKPMDPFLWITV
jgi:hypothetical protein